MMHGIKRSAISLMLGGVLLAGTLTGATAIHPGPVSAAAPAATNHALVKVVHEAKFGNILVNAKGYALYYFTPEKHGAIKCTGSCAKVWPPLLVPTRMRVARTLPGIMGTFGLAMRPDGTHQLTFDGKPLYTFVSDKKPGQVLCDGVGGWYAVRVMH